ncbi:carbonic anhydrase 2 isoform X2 [Ceratina calcarata]|uniref:Carbonic anhydrase n=1 Tax=Ceratina calcarata TaxID=156304 RepID=A0AAJ7JEV3_9HYME|nr:carbonic anhydrase 2 isoform X2 [Ceratina calcarata]
MFNVRLTRMARVIETLILIAAIPIVAGHFGYRRRDQYVWQRNFKLCGGKLQSPVSISSSTSKSIPVPLPALETIGYHDFLPTPLYLRNGGHSVLINIHDHPRRRLPCIFGGSLDPNHEYEMDHLHFHWGAKNDRGSEHVLNGVRYPMEMHIVHRNKVYSNFSSALDHKNGLAVLGIFFQLQEEDNELLNPVVKALKDVQLLNEQVKLNAPLALASLLPNGLDVFYTYKGSLTTPPCSEAVTWIIFPSPTPISFSQKTAKSRTQESVCTKTEFIFVCRIQRNDR